MQEFDIVIGLEIHVELKTNSKVFCGCKNEYGSAPNTNCCPVCIGLPGALPVLNKQAVKSTIVAGLAHDCEINEIAVFERKNYFYPDLSKAYQISQLVKPICIGGGISLDSGKFIRLNRIHLEEDAGKLTHINEGTGSLIDYNRASVPLIEIVTEPDISSANEALEFITKLRNNIVYTEIAECKMEEGGMRCDVNLSVMPKGSKILGTRTEMKNLNSFKMIQRAIESETERQINIVKNGGKITQETRRWDDEQGASFSMRSKETSQDYRYFPDPDILAVKISYADVEKIKNTLPILPQKLKKLLTEEYGLPAYDSEIILKNKETSTFYINSVKILNDPKTISNWLLTNILAKVKDSKDGKIEISEKQFTDIIKLVQDKKISKQNATPLIDLIWGTNKIAEIVATEAKMINNLNTSELESIIKNILAENQTAASQYLADKDKILNFLTGQVMRQTKGKADATLTRQFLIKMLEK